MSIASMSIAMMHSRAKGATKLVLIGIADHDGDGGAWPSVRTLARVASVDERSVQRALVTLQSLGEIRVDQQGGGTPEMPDHRRPNRYHFVLECPFDCDRSSRHRSLQQRAFDRVTPVSPGDASVTPPGDASVTPPGDASVTRTVRENPHRNPGVERPVPRHASQAVDNRPEHECDKGWLGETDDGRRIPCLLCKPHLRSRSA